MWTNSATKNFERLYQQTCVNHDYSVINRSDSTKPSFSIFSELQIKTPAIP
jgi:hypothetical protein